MKTKNNFEKFRTIQEILNLMDTKILNFIFTFSRFSAAIFSVNRGECDGQLREEGRAQVRGPEPPQLQGEEGPLIAWPS